MEPPKSLLDEFLERRPFRRALLGAVEKGAEQIATAPARAIGEEISDRLRGRLKERRK